MLDSEPLARPKRMSRHDVRAIRTIVLSDDALLSAAPWLPALLEETLTLLAERGRARDEAAKLRDTAKWLSERLGHAVRGVDFTGPEALLPRIRYVRQCLDAMWWVETADAIRPESFDGDWLFAEAQGDAE